MSYRKTAQHCRSSKDNLVLSEWRKWGVTNNSNQLYSGSLQLIGPLRKSVFSKIKDLLIEFHSTGEESLTIFLDKQKLNKKSEGNSNTSVVSLELLHQLAASYFTDRESTLRRLHHLQIATSAIKVRCVPVSFIAFFLKKWLVHKHIQEIVYANIFFLFPKCTH